MTKAAEELGKEREIEQISQTTARIMRSGEEVLDQEARDAAAKVGAHLDAHEVLCTERWYQQRMAVAEVKSSVDAITKKLDNSMGRVPVGLIAGLTGLVGWLAARAFPLH